MINEETIEKLSRKFQTTTNNVAREYIQHLFLSALYKFKDSENLLFKGGTALRILYQSPRFSEDLDFSSINFTSGKRIESIFISALEEIEKENITIELQEAKLTSGGYLGIIGYQFYHFKGEILFEVSLRKKIKIEGRAEVIISDYIPAYTIMHLVPKEIIDEKIKALLERGKPRDYYDLYFFLRHPELNRFVDKKNLARVKSKLLKEKINFKKELEVLLPISHHLILKEFKQRLLKEIGKYEIY